MKLISAEGHEFIIDRNAAIVSNTIKSMLQGAGAREDSRSAQRPMAAARAAPHRHARPARARVLAPCRHAGTYTETSQGEIRFPEITTRTLEKTIQYFYYKLKYTNNKEGHLPEFKIEPEHALELLMAANYLDT